MTPAGESWTDHDSRSQTVTRRQIIRLLGLATGFGAVRVWPWDAEPASAAQATFRSVQRINVPKGAIIRTVLKDLSPGATGTRR